MRFKFCYRTPFTKECVYIVADTLEDAKQIFNDTVVVKRSPVPVYLDYVWSVLVDNTPVYRFI